MTDSVAGDPGSAMLPKDVIVYHMNPDARNFLITLRLKSNNDAFSEVSSLLDRARVRVLSGHTSVNDGTEAWTFFAETSKKGMDANGLAAMLRALPCVKSLSVKADDAGIVFDDADFPLRWSEGQRAILIRTEPLSHAFGRILEKFGTGGEVILYEEGQYMGYDSGERLKEKLGSAFVRAHIEDMIRVYIAVGWGKFTLTSYQPTVPRMVLKVEDCFECNSTGAKSPHSQFVRGNVCGYFSSLLERELSCEETRCCSKGDPFCEFTLHPA